MRDLSTLKWETFLPSPPQWDTTYVLLFEDAQSCSGWLQSHGEDFLERIAGKELVVVERGPIPSFRRDAERFGEMAGDMRYVWLPDRHFTTDRALVVARSMATGDTVRFCWPEPSSTELRPDSDGRCFGASAESNNTSIIIAAYESADVLTTALSALRSGSQQDIEIVVCDDGSGPQFLTDIADQISTSPWPVAYCWQPDRGFRVAASRNNGLRVSLSPMAIFLDGDMIPIGDFVADHLRRHDQALARVVVGNRLAIPSEVFAAIPRERRDDRCLRELASRSIPDEDTKTRVRDIEAYDFHPWRVAFTCNLSVSGSRELFDEALRSPFGAEDVEWCYRLCRSGAAVKVTFGVEAAHIGRKTPYPANLMSASHEQIVLHLETVLYIISKYRNEPYMLSFLEILKSMELDSAGRWRVIDDAARPVYDSVEAYLRWRAANAPEVRKICTVPLHQAKR